MNTENKENQSKRGVGNTIGGFDKGENGVNASDGTETRIKEQAELKRIMQKVSAVKAAGFGEIRIVVRNGAIHRILVTEEELLTHNKIE